MVITFYKIYVQKLELIKTARKIIQRIKYIVCEIELLRNPVPAKLQ